MLLASVRRDGTSLPAAVVAGEVAVLADVAPELPRDMPTLLAAGESAMRNVRRVAWSGAGRIPRAEAELDAPVRPSKFFTVGLNCADHVAESACLDFEGELGIVIGRQCRNVSRARARQVIAGYVVVNDLTVRDWQHRTSQSTLGKSFETHGPLGPWIAVTHDLDPHNLRIRTLVNGEVRQESNTSNLIVDCYEQVELLSPACMREPGDVIATGTPGGVGMAFNPHRCLEPGDVVRVEIDGIGAIENTVIDAPTTAEGLPVAEAGQAPN
jgi:2-keto-4-pentenoate hydratase/2-oxohepta-3-ene-1,7-dioic acid hydratase in catechol pathway